MLSLPRRHFAWARNIRFRGFSSPVDGILLLRHRLMACGFRAFATIPVRVHGGNSLPYYNCTGFLYNGVWSSNCAALSTQFSMADVQLIWPPLCSRLMPDYHIWGQSTDFSLPQLCTKFGERACSHLVPLHGTHCPEHNPCWTWHSCF